MKHVIYTGKAYRAESHLQGASKISTESAIAYEINELGNDITRVLKPNRFDNMHNSAWVTLTEEDARQYGDEVDTLNINLGRVFAYDNYGGMLVSLLTCTDHVPISTYKIEGKGEIIIFTFRDNGYSDVVYRPIMGGRISFDHVPDAKLAVFVRDLTDRLQANDTVFFDEYPIAYVRMQGYSGDNQPELLVSFNCEGV